MQQTIEHQRIQEWYQIQERTWTESIDLGNGIWVYKNVIPNGKEVIDTMSKILDGSDQFFKWTPAYVGYGVLMPEYRDCYDFKYKPTDMKSYGSPKLEAVNDLYNNLYYRQLQPVKDYTLKYNIGELRYWEAMNLVKYGPNQHFQEHVDHGYSYNCTVSLVAYLNDDYSGGELYFRLQNLMIKPEAGDLFIFPSNFMYPHRAMPVGEGTKYSLVTMLDYSDKFHKAEFYRETGS